MISETNFSTRSTVKTQNSDMQNLVISETKFSTRSTVKTQNSDMQDGKNIHLIKVSTCKVSMVNICILFDVFKVTYIDEHDTHML